MIGHQAHPLRICDIIILFCLVPVVGLAQNISISDFRIPESKWQYFFGNLQGSFNMGNFDRQENYGTPIFHFRDESNNEVLLGAQGNYSFVHLNEEYSHEIYLDLNSRHGYSRNEVTDRDTALRYQDKRKGITEYAEMRPFWRYSSYIQPDFFYAFGSLEGRLMYSLYKNSYESFPGYLPQDYTSKNRLYSVTVSAGFGLGKIRDGRPVFRVLRYLDKDYCGQFSHETA